MHELKPKTIIDSRFEIIERLGAGGMGVVYKAQQVGFDRIVALKLMLPQLLMEPNSLARFEREAQALAALSHRNISLFYAYGIWQGRAPYIAMEYIDAPDLSERLIEEGGRLTWKRTLDIVRQIAEGIACAHSAGVIHRDLKPSNVCVLQDDGGDLVKVMDFGLAKVVDDQGLPRQKITATGVTVGSPLYMSPEQLHAQPVTPASDVYSLGCIMYQCIFGRPPHNPDDLMGAFLATQTAVQLPRPEQVKELPPGILRILETTLAKAPAERFQTADEMVDAIAEIQKEFARTPDAKLFWSAHLRASDPAKSGLSPAKISMGAFLLLLASLALVAVFSQPICSYIADQMAKSPDANSIKSMLAVADRLGSLGAYNQAGSFYDAALSISAKDPWQRTEIALAEAEMYKKYRQRDAQQAALSEMEKAFLVTVLGDQFPKEPLPERRKFVLDALIAISQWEPRHPVDATSLGAAFGILDRTALPDEAQLADAITLLSQKSIGNPNRYMLTTMSVAGRLTDGADAPYQREILKYASQALHTTHANPVAQRLLPICAKLWDRPASAEELLELRRAVCATPTDENADSAVVISNFHPVLSESVSAAALEDRIQFYRHGIGTQTTLAQYNMPDCESWSNCERDLADILLAQKRPDEAFAIYEQANRAIANNQNVPVVLRETELFVQRNKVAMAEILMQEGKWKEAEKLCREVYAESKEWTDFAQGPYADALLARCVAHNNGIPAAIKALRGPGAGSVVLPALGQFDWVKRNLKNWAAANKSPVQQSEAANSLAVFTMIADGDNQRACGYMKSALDRTQLETDNLNQRLAIRYAHYAATLAACDRLPEAEAALLSALKLAPATGEGGYHAMLANYDLANLLLHRGDNLRAARYFSDAETLAARGSPFDGLYRSIRAAHALANKDLSRAKREIRYALRETHENHSWEECQALAWQAEIFLAEGNRDAAQKTAAKAMKKMKAYFLIIPGRVLSSDYQNVQWLCKKLGVN